jgi:oxygen-dependent protoporphyrinogen oxidase
MKHIAILGGGIAGLAAAYELELSRTRGAEIDWHLYEASSRLGGTVETTQQSGFTLEGGPDGWITDKPWARDLAIELGLKADLIESNDATRKTYILVDNKLQPMPDRMRMMVPEDLSTLDTSPLFSPEAKAAYAAELANAAQLREAAPKEDESVASFVLRHFGEEVLTRIGAPLLSGVFGGDVAKLSVNAVMDPFVKMEREHGSLIAALQARSRERGDKPRPAIFTSLRNGLGSLTAALIATLPPERLHLAQPALSIKRQGNRWLLRTTAFATPGRTSKKHFHHILIATPIDAARELLHPLDAAAADLIPTDASSAVLATFCWPAETAATFTIPPGFGFLVPQTSSNLVISTEAKRSGETSVFIEPPTSTPPLLAATFADQKYPHRAPTGARILRAFFGTGSAEHFAHSTDSEVAAAAFSQLTQILGPLPTPDTTLTTVRRWPRSLPQYEVGHPERMAALDDRIANLGGLTLLGNGYRGVGLPDLIHASRNAANKIASLHP